MGLILLPFFFITIIIGIISYRSLLKHINNNDIQFKEIFFGLILSIVLFGLVVLGYIYNYAIPQQKAPAFGPAFMLPSIMVLLPSFIYLLFLDIKTGKPKYIGKIILSSIVISVFLGVIFNPVIFNLLDYLGIEKSY